MKLLIERVLFGARLAVVTWAVLALGLAGAGSAQRLYADQFLQESPPVQTDADVLDGKPDPAEAAGGMATPKGGRPCTEQSAWLQTVTTLPTGSYKVVLGQAGSVAEADDASHSRGHGRQTVYSTPAQVASHIAHLFTLVGARPSGTS